MSYIFNDPKVDMLRQLRGREDDAVEILAYDNQGRTISLRMSSDHLAAFKEALDGPVEPRLDAQPADNLAHIGVRIAKIVEWRFNNNQTAAAKAWGATLSVVNRVVHSQRLPNAELLFSIAKTPDLNATWLVRGIGVPFRTDQRG